MIANMEAFGYMDKQDANSDLKRSIVIDPDNIKNLQEVYGAVTDACRNKIVNDIVRNAIIRVKKW